MKSNQTIVFKFLISTLISALLTYAIGIYGSLPWWSFAASNFIVAILIVQSPGKAFLSGAIGVGALWAGLALGIDLANNHILSTKVATILPLNGSWATLIAITGVIGALIGGFSALAGSYLKKTV